MISRACMNDAGAWVRCPLCYEEAWCLAVAIVFGAAMIGAMLLIGSLLWKKEPHV